SGEEEDRQGRRGDRLAGQAVSARSADRHDPPGPDVSLDAATLSALLASFLEESFEGLDRAEAGLLRLADEPVPAALPDLFRRIHSLRGGAGGFGVAEVSQPAHIMENLLDDLRAGRPPTHEVCDALLAGVDALRTSLRERSEGRRASASAHDAICARLVA